MLNRTNRTLSANSHRLNLGTRSLVATTGELNGKATLYVRHAHAHGPSMRDGMIWSFDPTIRPLSIPRIAIPTIPGSSAVVSGRPVVGVSAVRPLVVSESLPAYPGRDAFAFAYTNAGCADRDDADQGQPRARSSRQERAGARTEAGREPLRGKRSTEAKAGAPKGRALVDQDAAAARAAAVG